eukprot:CAMPEP_0179050024 /NCGR_PEP_ID=MMETSP0796-20121207/20514_1 /TAXON_ID=73915 /ORGANISM="Pyrodinium bahamense, Strain pbaha01" /LENGTH=157 /DNA_ID=CAMNT_0020746517 /DNA_START=43 /DNA_END=513 /DNA_ORIENTATION=+
MNSKTKPADGVHPKWQRYSNLYRRHFSGRIAQDLAQDLRVGLAELLLALLPVLLGQHLVTTHLPPPDFEGCKGQQQEDQQNHTPCDAGVEERGDAEGKAREKDERDEDVHYRHEAEVGGVEPQEPRGAERDPAHQRDGVPDEDPEDVEEEVAERDVQ